MGSCHHRVRKGTRLCLETCKAWANVCFVDLLSPSAVFQEKKHLDRDGTQTTRFLLHDSVDLSGFQAICTQYIAFPLGESRVSLRKPKPGWLLFLPWPLSYFTALHLTQLNNVLAKSTAGLVKLARQGFIPHSHEHLYLCCTFMKHLNKIFEMQIILNFILLLTNCYGGKCHH